MDGQIPFLTHDLWDTLIYATIIIGGALALRQLWRDLSGRVTDHADGDERERRGVATSRSTKPEP